MAGATCWKGLVTPCQRFVPQIFRRTFHLKAPQYKRIHPLNYFIISRANSSDAHEREIIVKENGETVIRSPYPDVPLSDKTFGEFIFSYLDEFKQLDMMVRDVSLKKIVKF